MPGSQTEQPCRCRDGAGPKHRCFENSSIPVKLCHLSRRHCRTSRHRSRHVQLLAKGANKRACANDREGGTPLHEATSTGAMDAINVLLRHGASPFLINSFRALPQPSSTATPVAAVPGPTRPSAPQRPRPLAAAPVHMCVVRISETYSCLFLIKSLRCKTLAAAPVHTRP